MESKYSEFQAGLYYVPKMLRYIKDVVLHGAMPIFSESRRYKLYEQRMTERLSRSTGIYTKKG